MRILYYEIRKLFCSKVILMALLALLCMATFFNIRHSEDRLYSHSDYTNLMSELDGKSDDEIMEFLQSGLRRCEFYFMMEMGALTDDEVADEDMQFLSDYREFGVQLKYTDFLMAERQLYNDVYEQFGNVTRYTEHLDYIIEQSDRLSHFSVFSSDGNFEKASIEKTIDAYERLYDTEPHFIDSTGVNALLDFSVRDVLLLFSGILASFTLIYDEKRKGTIRLAVVTKNGRFPLALAKMLSLLIWVIASSLMLFLSSYLVFNFKYGIAEFTAPIQSVQGYINSTMKVNIGGMIALNESMKIFGVYAVTLIFAAMFCNKHSFTWAGIASALLVSGGFLYTAIPASSAYNLFKFTNIGGLISFTENSRNHFNVNLFGRPLNATHLLLVFLILLLISSIIIFILIFVGTCFQSTIWKFNFKREKIPKISLFRSEFYRSLFVNGGIYMLILLSAVQIYQYGRYEIPYDEHAGYYREYLNEIENMSIDEVGEFIAQEKDRFEKAHLAIVEIEQFYNDGELDGSTYLLSLSTITRQIASEAALTRIDEQYNYIATQNSSAKFVNEADLNQIMGVNGLRNEMKGVAWLALSLIVLICPMFLRFSDGENGLIKATRNGKGKALTVRIATAAISCAVVYLILVIPSLMRLLEEVRISDLSGAIQSLPHFREVTGTYTIGQYLIFAYAIKFTGVALSTASLIGICLICRRSILGYLISTLVLMLPILLYFLVDAAFAGFAFNRLLTGFGILL